MDADITQSTKTCFGFVQEPGFVCFIYAPGFRTAAGKNCAEAENLAQIFCCQNFFDFLICGHETLLMCDHQVATFLLGDCNHLFCFIDGYSHGLLAQNMLFVLQGLHGHIAMVFVADTKNYTVYCFVGQNFIIALVSLALKLFSHFLSAFKVHIKDALQMNIIGCNTLRRMSVGCNCTAADDSQIYLTHFNVLLRIQ